VIEMPEVDPAVEALVREERIVEAARVASERGDARTASALYERACSWGDAAREAMRAGDPARAIRLAVEARDEALAESAAGSLKSPEDAVAIAAELSQRGLDAWSAHVLERAGRAPDAARAWERAGHSDRAARIFETSGEPAQAVRVLESALRREPREHSLAVALGSLLARFGQDEAAVRALQRIPIDAPERRTALPPLAGALERLGLSRAARDAAAELARLGGPAPGDARRGEGRIGATSRVLLFGRYEALREVSSSAAARVIECLDVVRGDHVAVKLFAAWHGQGTGRDALARFGREVRALRAMDHPNVVPLLDFIEEGPAIVVAWMAGGTLESTLRSGPLAPARAIEIACALLSALADAHRVGILHRDVKPANVLFDGSGVARLSDFGAAHLADASTTATAGVFGTLGYMSPEQREGRPATPRSDIFAVGVLLAEMLTGERHSPTAAVARRLREFHSDLDERHDAVLRRMASPQPEGRSPDALEARAALLALAWPSHVGPSRENGRGGEPERPQPAAGRLTIGPDGRAIDCWTHRAIVQVPLSGPLHLARARAFALADHAGLQAVLRLDGKDERTLWLAMPEGRTMNRSLTADEATQLRQALAALHASGGAHGSVDARHVMVGGSDGPVLLLGDGPEGTASPEGDRVAMEQLVWSHR